MTPERQAPLPIAVFRAPPPALGLGASGCGCLAALLLVGATFIGLTFDLRPVEALPRVPLLLACVAATAAAFALQRLANRTVRVELMADPDRVVVSWDLGAAVLLLRDLTAWRDAPGGGVRLLRGAAPARGDPVVPPGPRRQALLEALARAGVPGPGQPPRAAPPPPSGPPLLEVTGTPPRPERLLLALTLVALAASLAATRLDALWLLEPAGRLLLDAPLLLVGAFVPWLVVHTTLQERRGRAVFRDDRLDLEGAPPGVPWEDVVGHAAASNGRCVHVLLRPGPLGQGRAPTSTPAQHAAALALLAARGVPAVELGGIRPQAVEQRRTPRPLATLEGWQAAGMNLPILAGIAVFVGGLVALGAGAAMARELALPSAGAAAPVALVAAAGLALLATRWVGQRAGTADLFRDRVCLHQGTDVRTVFLADLDAFDDASADVVRLVVRRPAGWLARLTAPGDLVIPARDEAGRTTLLATLSGAGLGRPVGPPRTLAPPGPPLLIATGGFPRDELLAALPAGALAAALLLLDLPPALQRAGWLTALALVVAAGFNALRTQERRGRVVFRDDRIERGGLRLGWDDLLGYSAEPGHVRFIVRWRSTPDTDLSPTAPAPTPAALEALRALLASKGVPEVVL